MAEHEATTTRGVSGNGFANGTAIGVMNGAAAPEPTAGRPRRRVSYPSSPQRKGRRAPASSAAAAAAAAATAPEPAASAPEPEAAAAAPAAGERRDLRTTALGRVEASELSVQLGAVGAARAKRVSVERGALGAALADRVEVSQGYARSILARNVQLDRAAARIVIAADVNAQRTAVMLLVARRVSGDVKVLLDWRGALAFGAAAGLVGGLVARSRRRRATAVTSR